MHIVKLIQYRYPDHSRAVMIALTALSCAGIAIGIGLLLLS